MSLKEKALGMNGGKGIPFMEGREKGELEEILGKVCNIKDYAFINGDDGEYAVFIVDEIDDHFYFGGSILTQNLKAFTEEEHEELKKYEEYFMEMEEVNKKFISVDKIRKEIELLELKKSFSDVFTEEFYKAQIDLLKQLLGDD